jgi:hypothetical protein
MFKVRDQLLVTTLNEALAFSLAVILRIAERDTVMDCKRAGRELELPPTLSQPKTCSPTVKTSIGRLTGSTTNATVRIRKLLTFANNCLTSNVFQAATARTGGPQRCVVDFGDFSI